MSTNDETDLENQLDKVNDENQGTVPDSDTTNENQGTVPDSDTTNENQGTVSDSDTTNENQGTVSDSDTKEKEDSDEIVVGSKVEINFRGIGRWYKGKITGKDDSGKYSIEYNDGDTENGVLKENIRYIKKEVKIVDKDPLIVGDKVECNYRGRGRWYPGIISDIHTDGTYKIDYNDGDTERYIHRTMIRISEGEDKVKENVEQDKGDDCIREGTRVKVNFKGEGIWYPGTVERVHGAYINSKSRSSLLYSIRCDNGERDYARRENIRTLNVEEHVQKLKKEKENRELNKENLEMKKYIKEFHKNIDDNVHQTITKDTLIKIIRNYDYNVEVYLLKEQKQVVEKAIQNAFFYDYINLLGDKITEIEYLNIIKFLERNFKIHSKKLLEQAEKEINNKIREKDMEIESQTEYLEAKQKEKLIEKTKNDLYMESEKNLKGFYIDNHIELKKKEEELRNAEQNLALEKRLLNLKEEKKEIYNRTKLINYNDDMEMYDLNSLMNNQVCGINMCCKQTVIEDFDKIYELMVNLPSLNIYEKNLILIRFKAILTYCALNYSAVTKFYNVTRCILITCSIVNPSLLSINSDATNPNYMIIYWTVWCSQIVVSLITGYIGMFKWDRKHLIFNAYKTKINQEIWLYLELAGNHYVIEDEEKEVNHSYYLNKFLSRLEFFYTQLKRSELEIEETKDDNKGNEKTGSSQTGKKSQETATPQDVLNSQFRR
jgi:hypothetical protein